MDNTIVTRKKGINLEKKTQNENLMKKKTLNKKTMLRMFCLQTCEERDYTLRTGKEIQQRMRLRGWWTRVLLFKDRSRRFNKEWGSRMMKNTITVFKDRSRRSSKEWDLGDDEEDSGKRLWIQPEDRKKLREEDWEEVVEEK